MPMPEKEEITARKVANNLVNIKGSKQRGATVFLGAGASISSGIPTWSKISSEIIEKMGIDCNGESPIEILKKELSRKPDQIGVSATRYSLFYSYIENKKPSLGYHHLSQLIAGGYISTVITTNWDCLLEDALSKHLPLDKIRVYTRGIVSDKVIVQALGHETSDDVVIIKLHGDIRSRNFFITDSETVQLEDGLEEALIERLKRGSYLVGTTLTDVNVLRLVIKSPENCYRTIFNPLVLRNELDQLLERAGVTEVSGTRKVTGIGKNEKEVNIGNFDDFFAQLNLSVQMIKTEDSEHKRKLNSIRDVILSKEESGLRYINNSKINEFIDIFWAKIKNERPDLIVFIDDPAAPGGLEMKRRLMLRLEEQRIAYTNITVKGEQSRTHGRQAKLEQQSDVLNPVRILVVDVITFSGKTLQLAKKEVEKKYPTAVVKMGVLVISQHLISEDTHNGIIYASTTDRFELFFPWGVTQTTSDFKRKFDGLDDKWREILINKRAWGALEILAEREYCSVRLLVIEANKELSFQRHLCRDEMYIALDDNISLRIAGAIEDTKKISRSSQDIHSLILEKGDYVYIPRGIWHQPQASMDRVRILELAFGVYDQEDDIERLYDSFGREKQDGKS